MLLVGGAGGGGTNQPTICTPASYNPSALILRMYVQRSSSLFAAIWSGLFLSRGTARENTPRKARGIGTPESRILHLPRRKKRGGVRSRLGLPQTTLLQCSAIFTSLQPCFLFLFSGTTAWLRSVVDLNLRVYHCAPSDVTPKRFSITMRC